MGTGLPSGVTKKFWNWVKVVLAQPCECTKCCQLVHFKMVNMVNFLLCVLYTIKKQ